MARKITKADPFDVWGHPNRLITDGLTERQATMLRRYVNAVTDRAYSLGHDNGLTAGLAMVASKAHRELKKRLR